MRVEATVQLFQYHPDARLYLGPHVSPDVRGKCLVYGRADDVGGDEERKEHEEHKDGIHYAHVHALLLEEADLHHQHEEERGQRAKLAGGHEQIELLRVEGRAPHEHDEKEAADEHFSKELQVAALLNEGGHGHEAGLARHLEELVVPELCLELAADEANPCLIPREYRVVLEALPGGWREVGAQGEVDVEGDAEGVQADEDERDGGAGAGAALDVFETREHADVVVLGAASK